MLTARIYKGKRRQEMRRESTILAKFKKPNYIETDEEMNVLEKWALGGLVKFGADLISMKAEATLTKRGKWLLPGIIKREVKDENAHEVY